MRSNKKTDHVKLTGWKLEVPLLATPDYGQTVLRRLSRISQHFLGAKSTPQSFCCCFGLIFFLFVKRMSWLGPGQTPVQLGGIFFFGKKIQQHIVLSFKPFKFSVSMIFSPLGRLEGGVVVVVVVVVVALDWKWRFSPTTTVWVFNVSKNPHLSFAYQEWATGSSEVSEAGQLSLGFLGVLVFPKKRVPPKSSILIGFSIINHPLWGTPIFGNTHIQIYNIYIFLFLLSIGAEKPRVPSMPPILGGWECIFIFRDFPKMILHFLGW